MEIDSIGLHLPSHKMGGQGRKTIITYNSPKRYRRGQEPDFPTEERLSFVQPLSLASLDSSPSRGASGEEEKFSAMPKPPLGRGGGTASAVTERLSSSPKGGAIGRPGNFPQSRLRRA